jgi:hypothetical protein
VPDHRCLRAARGSLVALASCGAACAPAERAAVAPFGGELASALPHRDVLGFVRFRPSDEFARGLAEVTASWPPAAALGVAGPLAAVLDLALQEEPGFAGEDEPLVAFLLDSSVHGALAAFAWRGDAGRFRAKAREAGLPMPGLDLVLLPGRGRIQGIADVASDLMRLRRIEGEDEESAGADDRIPRVRYHLVERDGMTLLAPARDGVRNLLETLRVTRALDPGAGSGACLRIDLGRVVAELRDDLRNAMSPWIEFAIGELRVNGRERRRDRHETWNHWRLHRQFHDLLDAMLDLAASSEHVFIQIERGRVDLYLAGEAEGFLRRASRAVSNRPIEELVAGVPPDVDLAVAGCVDPKVVPEVPSIWRESRRGFFARRRRSPVTTVVVTADEEEEGRFLDSFGGRFWIALSDAARDEEARGPPFELRVFTEFRDDEANEGLAAALLEELLPDAWLQAIRVASIGFYEPRRVAGGCLESIGPHPGAMAAREERRLADPEPLEVAWDGAQEAFFFARLRLPDAPEQAAALTLSRDERGVRAVLTLPVR